MSDYVYKVGPCHKCNSENISKLEALECEEQLQAYIKERESHNDSSFTFPVKLSDIDYGLICDDCDDVITIIEKYKEEYKPENQEQIEGICINPKQRCLFDALSNELRPFDEHDDWFRRPYVVSHDYQPSDDSYEAFVDRLKSYRDWDSSRDLESKEEWTKRTEKQKASFYKEFPSGTRFDVRCYDGGAWDRSTARGWTDSLKRAVEIAKDIELVR